MHSKNASDDGVMVASQGDKASKFKAIRNRRLPSQEEQYEIDTASKKWLPKIFTSGGDPISADIASPTKTALLAGIGGGLVGAGIGAAGGAATAGIKGYDTTAGATIGAAATGIPSAILAAAIAYQLRKARNKTLEDYILRLPKGATRRDLEFNPVHQIEEGDDEILRTAKINAAIRGVFRPQLFEQVDGQSKQAALSYTKVYADNPYTDKTSTSTSTVGQLTKASDKSLGGASLSNPFADPRKNLFNEMHKQWKNYMAWQPLPGVNPGPIFYAQTNKMPDVQSGDWRQALQQTFAGFIPKMLSGLLPQK